MNPVVTHSLKAPGFNHRAYEVIFWFLKVCFFKLLTCTATTGWMFRPVVDNPYLHLNEDEMDGEGIEMVDEGRSV